MDAQFLKSVSNAPSNHGGSSKSPDATDPQLLETAKQFESLLVHNMLKSMRTSIQSDETSNEMSLYNDMLDKQLASVIGDSGKMGIADSIVKQLKHENQPTSQPANNLEKLSNKIAAVRTAISPESTAIPSHRKVSDSAVPGLSAIDIIQFRKAAGLFAESDQSQSDDQKQSFIAPLLPHAYRNARRLGTSAHAILAVAALETGWGKKIITDETGQKSYNLFGIKSSIHDRNSVSTITTEYIDGKPEKIRDNFRVYKNPADSIDGFADFILENPRYQRALKNAANPTQFLIELQRAGYATDPHYASKAIKIMHQIDQNSGTSK